MKTIAKLAMAVMLVPLCLSQGKAQDFDLTTNTIRVESIKIIPKEEGQKAKPLTLNLNEFNTLDGYDINFKRRSRRNRINGFWDREWDIDKYYPRRGTQNFVNLYIGLNNYLEDGDLPNSNSLLNLQPLSSWYAGLSFDNVTNVFGPLYIDWGAGVSVQSFSFENTRVRLVKGDDSISLVEDTDITGKKSLLRMSHINLHFVPTISFGRYRSFRVGFGGYAGYRIGANAKYKYNDAEGDRQKDKISDNWFVNPFRYGARATIGWHSFDLFFNYDLTELFEEDIAAPRLNPVTFGIIF